jgi:phosphatidylserine/phosphatidylglycerophosphate/cardiolipin synthase-like enzyme
MGRSLVARVALLLTAALLLAACATLPPLAGRVETTAATDTGQTRLGQAVAPIADDNPGKTGIHTLPIPLDAFAARALLAGVAERSVDAQYYIWHGDQTGYLLFEALWKAAERGVRVRLLLDDFDTAGLDETIAALDTHSNIEVRLYNPFVYRRARGMNFVLDFTRVNRRMHNKAFIADNQVAVVGGRNIANEYMGAGNDVVFADLDVIAVGPAVRDVSKEFDLYWNSESAYPAWAVLGQDRVDAARLQAHFAAAHADPQSVVYLEALRKTPLLNDLVSRRLAFEWTDARVVHDDPEKTLDTSQRTDILLLPQLLDAIGRPEKSFDLISPYFVPGETGTAALVALAKRGVKVRVLTNSLASTDVVAVHAGYAKRRRDLLDAGIALYELKTSAVQDDPEHKARFGMSSSSSLHAKTFAIDENRAFVGSFNFDQRSTHLNTEMGLVIESPTLARQIASAFDTTIPKVAYEVRVTAGGALEWIERSPSGVTRFDVEPGASPGKRSLVEFLSVLPIEWLL